MKITYTKKGDYLFPDLKLPEQKKLPAGKYALLRLNYLKEHRRALYTMLKMQGKLAEHLESVQFMANWHVNAAVAYIAEQEGVTEELKDTNQMEWVGRMNNIKNRVEESVIKEIIYDGRDEQ